MQSVIESLESRQLMSASLSGSQVLDLQPTEGVIMGQVSNGNRDDFFLVRMNKPGQIHVRLEGLTGDATLELIHDRNHNNRQDRGEVVQKSAKLGASNELIRRMVQPGTYHFRVSQAEGNAVINYTLRFSNAAFTTPDQVDQTGNTVDTARDFTMPINSNRSVNEHIGNGDDRDVFRFNASQTMKLDIRLSGLTKDADVTLRDADGNLIATTVGKSRTAKLISGKVNAGTYYMTVTPATAQPTGYSLRVSTASPRTSDVNLTPQRATSNLNVFSQTLIESK